MYGMTAAQQREANYKKNRGDPGQWFAHTGDYSEPQPPPRTTAAAERVATKYRACESREVMGNDKLAPGDDPVPVRLRDGTPRRNADKFQNQDDKWFDFQGNQQYRPDPPPTRLGTNHAKSVKEKNEQQREHDWYGHRSDPNDTEPAPKGRCPTSKSSENKERMHHKVDWNEHPTKAPEPQENAGAVMAPPRTKPQGMEYAMRSRGSASEWMGHKTVQEDGQASQGGPYRCNTSQAAANWERSRGTAMRDCFDYTSGYTEPQPAPKAHGKAEEYLARNQQGSSALWKQSQEADQNDQPHNRTRPEARAIADKNAGSLGKWMDQQANQDYSSPRPQPRLPSGVAQAAAERNKGVMGDVMDKPEYFSAVYKKPGHPRGTGNSAAKAVATANKGCAAANVMGRSDLAPETPRGGRAVTAAAEGNAQRNKGSVGALFTDYGRLGPEDPPAPRLRPEARGNAERFRGGDFFNVIQQK